MMPDGEDIFLRDLRRSVERCDEEAASANPVNVAAIRIIKPLVVRGKWLSSYGGRLALSGRHNAMHDWKMLNGNGSFCVFMHLSYLEMLSGVAFCRP